MITPDVRGRGRSLCPHPEENSWDVYAQDVVVILDELAIERAVVGGVSLGAGIALATALRHPQRVEALVLHSNVYAGEESGWLESQKAAQSKVLEAAETVLAEDAEVQKVLASPKWARHDPKSIAAALVGVGYAQPFRRAKDLEPLDVAAMIVSDNDALHLKSGLRDVCTGDARRCLGGTRYRRLPGRPKRFSRQRPTNAMRHTPSTSNSACPKQTS